mmetsp:Transcript_49755/g.95103  ORF Transcript_49755/g.95103 Transcript_49755/m.95103 type:complete len:272 (+) Transcript_49755:293-1108(+)|eukprot:CAMPEP_0114230222 /NCGR_PEP_ID=MMETSP0058-20121206/3350_1 /TAXON_ID=36894 /ORGANISM="Pyramimonas parkeae, CCMP726" /LENGTH=271 /DNA_ID=CAMNT_0001341399 /DNA_START=232 /DNA_END=1047 /DNA_ORIENTATION=-
MIVHMRSDIVPGGPLVAGFTAGLLHVVAGPDHVAALAPLAVRNRLKALRTGALWGAGHGTGVLILGSLGIFAKTMIDVEFLSRWSEAFVGAMLLGIGAWAARQTYLLHRQGFVKSLSHLDSPDDCEGLNTEKGKSTQLRPTASRRFRELQEKETAPGSPTLSSLPPQPFQEMEAQTMTTASHAHAAAFGVGLLHGAAGTGHLFGVLPSLALPPFQAACYLGSYLVAAILAMCGVGCVLGSIGDYGGPKAILWLMGVSSAVAMLVGMYWILG